MCVSRRKVGKERALGTAPQEAEQGEVNELLERLSSDTGGGAAR